MLASQILRHNSSLQTLQTTTRKITVLTSVRYVHKINNAFHSQSPLNSNNSQQSEDGKQNKRNYFNYLVGNLVGLSFGAIIGCSIKVNLEKEKKLFPDKWSIIPTVNAALPFIAQDDTKDKKDDVGSNRKKYNFVANAVEKVNDGVVYIEIKDHRRKDRMGKILTMSNGSGFLISEDGLILTNAHVVTNRPRSSSLLVRLHDGREFNGTVEEVDALSDLALVRIECKDLPSMKLGSSSDLRPGEFVVALGSPLSLSNTITFGVVSSIGRGSKELGIHNNMDYIQTDAAITFGNSGGPLVNLDGEVIGINSMKVTSGISFAIPVDYAVEFIQKASDKRKLKEKYSLSPGKSATQRRRYLGITMLTLTSQILQELQSRPVSPNHPFVPSDVTHGILVWRVVVGSPAYHAGLQPGDIVTHVNGKDISSARDVYNILDGKGDLMMVVQRGSQKYNVTVSPEE